MLLALRRHPWLTAAFVVFTALALWLLVQTLDHARGWHGSSEEEVRPWMTVGYVGHPPDAQDACGLISKAALRD